jgi:hypothetical protein
MGTFRKLPYLYPELIFYIPNIPHSGEFLSLEMPRHSPTEKRNAKTKISKKPYFVVLLNAPGLLRQRSPVLFKNGNRPFSSAHSPKTDTAFAQQAVRIGG